MQLGFAKGYDSFSPMGPSLISRQAWNSAAGGKHLKTLVNGKVVQDAALDTMTFSPEKIISFLSQGQSSGS
jgi:2-keto-4-pentenoate hydratase/2-oxohepta-3-ene-1,7-dioic acid hydratase in catechol pathway